LLQENRTLNLKVKPEPDGQFQTNAHVNFSFKFNLNEIAGKSVLNQTQVENSFQTKNIQDNLDNHRLPVKHKNTIL